MAETRLKTVMTYQTVNEKGETTIDIKATIADQSPASASMMLLNLMEGLAKIPKSQVEGL